VIYPYARAVCLKSELPPPYRLPAGTLSLDTRYYVPTRMFTSVASAPVTLGALFFLERAGGGAICRRISAASAVTHIVANLLNSLAHAGSGLAAAAELAARLSCYGLNSDSLDDACAAVEEIMTAVPSGCPPRHAV